MGSNPTPGMRRPRGPAPRPEDARVTRPVDSPPGRALTVRRSADGPAPLNVNLAGVTELRLVVTDAGDGINYDHANWADAQFIRLPE